MADLFIRGASGVFAAAATVCNVSIDGTGCDLAVGTITYNSADTINSATYAGAAATLVDTVVNGALTIATYQKIAPATGVNNFAFNCTGGFTSSGAAGAQMFNGTDQVTPLGAANKAQGTSTTPSVTVTSIGANNSGFDHVGALNVLSAPTQTQAYLDNSNTFESGGSHAAGNASRTFAWTVTPSDIWASIAFEVFASGGAVVGADLRNYPHPGQSPGNAGLSGSARFLMNWWPYSPPAAADFDPALLAAMNWPWPVTVFSPPQVVASGMTPPDHQPN